MARLQNIWCLLVMIFVLSMVASFAGCGTPPFVQPEQIVPAVQATIVISPATSTPPTAPAFTATVEKRITVAADSVTENSTSELPISTPTSLLVTNSPVLTVTPHTIMVTDVPSVSLSPTLTTQTIPAMTITEPITGFQITEATLETNISGVSQLNLPITLNRAKLQPPVQELIYLITAPLDDQLAETTIWRANLKDISNPTVITRTQHLKRLAGATNPALSPDGKYLVYGQDFDNRTGAQLVWLLDIDQGNQQIITKDAYPQNNSQTFLWSTDSKSILYTTLSPDWDFSAVNQYFIETEETGVIFSDNGFINFVGWWDQFIYYIPMQISDSSYNLRSFNFETKQRQEIVTITESYAINSIKMSPDGTQTLFTLLLVNLQSKSQTRIPISSQVLWFPDGQGVLGGSPLSALYIHEVNPQATNNVTSTLNLPIDIDGEHLVAWSPDGQYLIYKAKSESNQAVHFLLDLHSGQTQQFPSTRIFQVGGWLTR